MSQNRNLKQDKRENNVNSNYSLKICCELIKTADDDDDDDEDACINSHLAEAQALVKVLSFAF